MQLSEIWHLCSQYIFLKMGGEMQLVIIQRKIFSIYFEEQVLYQKIK